jgi:NhaP-type Na+/H+ or K+/H+ antiporter
MPVVGAVGSFGIADARGGSGFIAAFVGGVVFGIIAGPRADVAAFSEELGSLLNGLTLIVFGAAVLGTFWSDIGLKEIVYAVLSLTVIRMVPVAIAMLGTKARAPTVLFVGWFGPRGLASIVFGVVVIEGSQLPHISTMIVVMTATVALSVVAHGVTAAPLVRRYVAWHTTTTPGMESTPTTDQRWRHALPTSTPAAPSTAR